MPLLNAEQIKHLKMVPVVNCKLCHQPLTENYCNECDEFFRDGHEASCTFMKKTTIFEPTDDHRKHRTALREAIVRDIDDVGIKLYTPEQISSPKFFKRD